MRKYGYPGDDKTRIRLFERWERFWALATLEFRGGALERGDEDAMRGVRGATRAWRGGNTPLPLDFPLISRQSELGGLGAYLSSLREYGLVFPGSLRVTPAAGEMIDSFWSEPRERNWNHLYEKYALNALDLESPTIARSSGRLTLAGLGKRSRLSSLVHRGRTAQQGRLWNALFVAARDGSTHPLAKRLVAAHNDGVDAPETFLEGLLADRWEKLTSDLVHKVEVALAFGRLARVLLRRFDRAYGYVDEHGWVADFDAVAQASFPGNEAAELHGLCKAVRSAHDTHRFRNLLYHGPDFLKLVEKLTTSGDALAPSLRVRVVEQLARYLTYKQVTFLPDLLSEANATGLSMDPVRSIALLEYMPRFWQTDVGRRWARRIRTFLSYFCQRGQDQQREILDGPIRTGDFARHTRDGESRERLREAFNTPLYPMVLIANEVMQEGLDLHQHCRRVVHHDLVWNPAQIEQRIGRIDRLGSLTNRLRQRGADVALDILYPVIRGTIDKRLFRTVKTREKWLEFLLGAAPNFSEYSFTDEEPAPLPDRLGADLAIDLGPG